MEECKEILQEIQIDWDSTLHNNFNPLKLSLKVLSNSNTNKEFRETFHRLESAMDNVIKSNFDGFSESFRSFEKLHAMNSEIMKKYEIIESLLDKIEDLQDNLDLLTFGISEESVNKSIYKTCAKIIEARNLYKEFAITEDNERKANLIIKSIRILREPGHSQIRGVFEFYKIVFKNYLKFCNQIHSNLLDFAIKNEPKNITYFSLVLNLQSVSYFNQFCSDQFYQKVFNFISQSITKLLQVESCTIEMLCEEVMGIIEIIIENMTILIKRFSKLGTSEDEDFFGKVKVQKGFIYEIDVSINALNKILLKIIDIYSFEFEPKTSFDITYASDFIDFSKTFSKHSNIYKRLTSNNVNYSCGQFALVTGTSPQTAEILLKFAKTPEIRSFLHRIIESKNFLDSPLQNKIDELEKINFFENLPSFSSTIHKLLECSLSGQEDEEFKAFLNKKILKDFSIKYDEIFESDLIKMPNFNVFLETPTKARGKLLYSIEELKDLLIRKPIAKKSLFLKSKKYEIVNEIIDQFKIIEKHFKSQEITLMLELFVKSLTMQVIVDFFYFYDLLYRQGNYHYYMKMCFEVLQIAKNYEIDIFEDLESCFIYYNKMNVASIKPKNVDELKEMISFLEIFYEISGPEFEIIKVIEFFKGALGNQASDRQSKILKNKVS